MNMKSEPTTGNTILRDVRSALIRLESPWRDLLAPGMPAGLDDETATAFGKPEADRSPRDVELIYETLARDKRVNTGLWSIVLDPVTWNARRLLVATNRADQTVRTPRLAESPRHRRGRSDRAPDLLAPPRRVWCSRARDQAALSGGALFAVMGKPTANPSVVVAVDRPAHGPGRLAGTARPSAHGSGDGQPALAASLRQRAGRHSQ